MKIFALDYDEFRNVECGIHEECVLTESDYSPWERARKILFDELKTFGTWDEYQIGEGDFLVGDDWFEKAIVHVAICDMAILTQKFVLKIVEHLIPGNDVLKCITVVKSTPGKDEMVEIVLCPNIGYTSLYPRSKEECMNFIKNNNEFKAISPIVEIPSKIFKSPYVW